MKHRGESRNSVVLGAYTEVAKGFGLTLDEFLEGVKAGSITVTPDDTLRPPYRFVVARGDGVRTGRALAPSPNVPKCAQT